MLPLGRLNRLRLDPVAWSPAAPSLPPAGTTPVPLLDRVQRWPLPRGKGPEDVAVDGDGRVVTGTASGEIYRFDSDGRATLIATTGGRPLGIEVLDDGRLLVCDAQKGLLRVDDSGRVEELLTSYEGKPLLLTNNAAVGGDGTIYFSDSSQRHRLASYRLDLIEHRGSGRLFRLDPASGSVDVLLDGLAFANGVTLLPGGSAVLVAETAGYRIHRVALTGEQSGQSSLFVDGLPGFPDNLSTGPDGTVWAPLPSPRDKVLDRLLPQPAVRGLIAANLPERLQPQPQRYSQLFGFDASGRLTHAADGPEGRFAMVTGARESDGWIYLSSLTEESIARIPVPSPLPVTG
jgi:sugar lactone lactonase YvrE